MSWLQLHIPARREQVEPLQDALEEMGSQAVTVRDAADDPVLEPAPGETPVWEQAVITALFQADREPAALIDQLARRLGFRPEDYRFEELADRDWERSWMDDFHPLQFGERLWIVPSWQEPPEPDAVNLKLDPGLAFGTGTHETTALCLEWLDRDPPRELRVIDYGCGSGVLAIAALLLGADSVIGCDLDPQALQASRENALLNGVADRLHCYLPDSMPDSQADLVLANILAGPLCQLAPELTAMVRPGGHLILSGILTHQAEEVAAAYAPWFDVRPPQARGDWVRIEAQRKP